MRPPHSPQRPGRRRRATAGAGLVTAALMGVSAVPAAAAGAPGPSAGEASVDVVVEGGSAAAAAAVGRLGGTVEQRLAVVDGLSARVPVSAVPALTAVPGVRAVTRDARLVPLDEQWGDDDTREDEQASVRTGEWRSAADLSIARRIGADDVWRGDDVASTAGVTGAGVGVALIDTGVTPVHGLSGPGKLVNGPDLSLDSQAEGTRYLDGYGHGTHMAGIIAGDDLGAAGGELGDLATAGAFEGIAPGATVVNVKAGAADGSVDVSQVIAAVDWVVENKDSHHIRVLNLSYGTPSTQTATLDPLAHAVESAWRAGIVVVVAAGNDGDSGPHPLTMPAADPFVIAVGSSDHQGSEDVADTVVGSWTSSGTPERRPDLLAPGKSVVSLRVPGSVADVNHPEGLVTGDADGRLFRGTGTSQSAAVVSGAAALLLERDPGLTPDQVKGLLTATADRLVSDTSPVQGAGVLDVAGADALLTDSLATRDAVPTFAQSHASSTGTGSLEASRGGSHIADPTTGVELTGEQDIFGEAWDAPAWASAATGGTTWSGGTWRGHEWAGPGWVGTSWAPVAWAGTAFSGVAWSDQPWSRMSWRSDDWSRMSWRGDDWSRMSWRSDDWSRMSWRSAGGF